MKPTIALPLRFSAIQVNVHHRIADWAWLTVVSTVLFAERLCNKYLWHAERNSDDCKETVWYHPSFSSSGSTETQLTQNLRKSFALSKFCQSFHDIIPASLIRWSWYYALEALPRSLFQKMLCLKTICMCWNKPMTNSIQSHNEKPYTLVVASGSPFQLSPTIPWHWRAHTKNIYVTWMKTRTMVALRH